MRILLVEDDVLLADGIKVALSKAGFTVDAVHTAQEALSALTYEPYQAAIFDLGLPDMDGLELLAQVRRKWAIPILILTARDRLDDKVRGLDLGADDYLSKPFEIEELSARLRALLRRRNISVETQLEYAGITLNPATLETYYQGSKLDLARRELMVLRILLENAGKVVTRTALSNQLYSWDEEVGSNTLEVYIHQLRKQTDKNLIRTIRGVGYILQAE